MNEFSRRGFLGLAGAAGVAGLAACAGTGTAPSTGSGGGSSNTIEFWSNHPGNSKPVEQEIIKAFEAANSGLKVKLVDAGKNYEEVAQKFNASLAGGSLPDVVVVSDVTWFNFALNKQLSPLDELLATAKLDTSDYVDALYNDYNLDDKHYALPFSRSTPLFYYNKDLWKAAGLEDRGPKDWDEFLTWAPKLKAAAGSDKIVMELPDGSNYLDWVFQNMVWGYGGAYSKEWTPTFSDPNTVKAGTYLQNLAKDGYLKLSKDPAPDFTAGIVGCSMMSTGSLGGVAKDAKFPVGTAFLPTDGNCPTGGAGVGIPANISDDRKKNALTFIEFLTNAQNTVTFTQATGYMPVRKSAVELPEEKAFLEKNPNAKTAIEQLPKTRSQDNVRVLLPGGGARIGKGLDQIVQGQDVATVFKALDAESQQVFDSQIKSKLGA
ncbi:ABC transporter substrate-binding protein [Terrabacter sp. Soil810]|uniref:ABC transporter substrate-binding protein n=1 Tax=Terrabacter sp. Soil810 TaxID=1736418 RepID=UPI00070A9F5A|nr:ABC transporter substrate-binding protein [Terrabacter sp. Soil810]KRF41465.1 ABC transporter substrate-binding protein [Terrabacter sp. Soil810]